MVSDGRAVNVWDAMSVGIWAVALGLIVADSITYDGDGMGPLTPYGGFLALVSAVITTGGIARRCSERIVNDLRTSFDLGYQAGRDSVTDLQRRR